MEAYPIFGLEWSATFSLEVIGAGADSQNPEGGTLVHRAYRREERGGRVPFDPPKKDYRVVGESVRNR